MQKRELIEIRNYRAEDENFIYKTWLEGLYHGNGSFRDVRKSDFISYYREAISEILLSLTCQINVACLKEDQDTILGYSVLDKFGETPILQWVWVRPIWRKLGIAKDLVPAEIKIATHMTKMGKITKPSHMTYNPFIR